MFSSAPWRLRPAAVQVIVAAALLFGAGLSEPLLLFAQSGADETSDTPPAGDLAVVVARPAAISGIGDDVPDRLSHLIVETFRRELLSSGVTVVDIDGSAAASPSTPSLEVRYYVSGPLLYLFAELSDRAEGTIGGGIYVGTTDVALVTTVRRATDDLVAQLRELSAVDPGRIDDRPVLLELEFSSPDDGSTVFLGTDSHEGRRLGTIRDGRLEAPFAGVPVGTTVQLVHAQEGRYTRTIEFEVTAERATVELEPLDPVVKLEFSGVWTTQRPIGIGGALREYIVPARLFFEVEAAIATYYRFAPGTRGSSQIDGRMTLGGYPFGTRGSPVRLSVATGAGVVTTLLGSAEKAHLFGDPYFVPLQFVLDVPFAGATPFVRLATVFYTGAAIGLLSNGIHPYLSFGVRFPWFR